MTDPLELVDWPVRTERLLLRRAAEDDIEPTWRFRLVPGVSEWLSSDAGDLASYRDHFLRQRLPSTVVVELGGVVIGDLMIKVEDAWAQVEVADRATSVQAELGWTFDPSHGGHGYATEAVRAAIDLCFGPLGLHRVHADCFADNAASWRLMERLGMRREAHNVRESLHRTRGWLDGFSYALLAEEWPTDAVSSGRSGPSTRR